MTPQRTCSVRPNVSIAVRGATARLLVVAITWSLASAAGTLAASPSATPVSFQWSPAADLLTPRGMHAATRLGDGSILLTGGIGRDGQLASAEIWRPDGAEAAGVMHTAPVGHTATLLPDGRVLVAGGLDDRLVALDTLELWDPVTHRFEPAGTLWTARGFHTADLLPDGSVLFVGGFGNTGERYVGTAERWDPVTSSPEVVGELAFPRRGHASVAREDGSVIVAGGEGQDGPLASIEVWRPDDGFAAGGELLAARAFFDLVQSNGTPVVIGGSGGNDVVSLIERLDLDTLETTPSGELASPSGVAGAVAFADGVLKVGGLPESDTTSTVEFWSDGAVTAWPELSIPRHRPAVTSLNGTVVVLGGWTSSNELTASSEILGP